MEKKTALITGGSSGIGAATCIRLAKAGMNIIVNYSSNKKAADYVVETCRSLGVQAINIQADVSKKIEVESMFIKAFEQFKQIDVLVNNAGITNDKLLIRMDEDDFNQVLQTNLTSAFLCTKVAVKFMMKQRYGRIINMSSIVGLHGNVGQTNYAASKAGLIGLTKSVAQEVAKRGITVNAIAPGFIASKMTESLTEEIKDQILQKIPMGEMGCVDDIAHAVAFLSSDEARYITGTVLEVTGGMSM